MSMNGHSKSKGHAARRFYGSTTGAVSTFCPRCNTQHPLGLHTRPRFTSLATQPPTPSAVVNPMVSPEAAP